MARRVDIVPHTHWDREWYRPFQSFRMRLVDLVDRLLDRLDADPGYGHFMLDGQMAVVDDYLEVRPDAAEELARLNREGRLTMGPWYVLPDEFLVSGETLVRNLQLGLRRAREFGGAMEVGYLPDMFGHIAAMPQLLRLFGMEHAVVWRGVQNAITAPVAISQFTGSSQFEEPTGAIAAAAVVITIPIIIFVLFFQRRIVAGLTSGAVKG